MEQSRPHAGRADRSSNPTRAPPAVVLIAGEPRYRSERRVKSAAGRPSQREIRITRKARPPAPGEMRQAGGADATYLRGGLPPGQSSLEALRVDGRMDRPGTEYWSRNR
jgi:hypothetical protein